MRVLLLAPHAYSGQRTIRMPTLHCYNNSRNFDINFKIKHGKLLFSQPTSIYISVFFSSTHNKLSIGWTPWFRCKTQHSTLKRSQWRQKRMVCTAALLGCTSMNVNNCKSIISRNFIGKLLSQLFFFVLQATPCSPAQEVV